MELQISGTALGTTGTSDPPALGRDSIPHTGDALSPISVTSCFPVAWSPPKPISRGYGTGLWMSGSDECLCWVSAGAVL